MEIIVNGQQKELDSCAYLNEIISQFCVDCKKVIAEVNGEIIKNPQWSKTSIKDGDIIELVSFVGGG